ncbi:TIGR02391 family protein [Cryobacterium soli]|uniref:TIGR02391 family protein n=1 Tax=Cryobacterium soli TaxID=2220095 RepID=UPI0013C534BE|nr:TIGR02391 family protein [Cryobacterium soli]
MNNDWALSKLDEFLALSEMVWRTQSGSSFPEVAGGVTAVTQSAQVVEKILDRVTPAWRKSLVNDDYEPWQPTRLAVMRAQSEIRNSAEVAQMLGEDAPAMRADAMHRWAWDAARSLWQSGHFGEAVRAATVKLNAEMQNKVGRRDVSETALFQQAFSADAPSQGSARLRPVGDDGGKTALSVRRGIVSLAEGLFAAVRNPASHDVSEGILSEQIALEQLALVSLLARWVEGCTVVRE